MRGKAKLKGQAPGRRRRGPVSWLGHLFRERQIYVRSHGRLQYITLRPWMFATGLTVLLAGSFSTAYFAVDHTVKQQLLALKDQRIASASQTHRSHIDDLQAEIEDLRTRLMLDQQGYLGEVDKLRRDFDDLSERHRALSDYLLDTDTTSRDAPADPPPETNADTGKRSLNELTFGEKYAARFRSRAEALAPLNELRARFTAMLDAERATLDALVNRNARRMAAAEKLFAGLGIKPDSVVEPIVEETDEYVGGPFLPISLAQAAPLRTADRLAQADRIAMRTTALIEAARALPMAMPVDKGTRISSRFGLRRDPFRRVAAMHTGVDFRGSYQAPVRATAPGLVVKAGWEGSYGRIVRIRHRYGVTTRFAHLAKLEVKTGQKVEAGDIIGLIGNTGRSTGPHLHYETRIKGRAIDPALFWKVEHGIRTIRQ